MNDLELALRELDVEWPATPDLAGGVRARIETPVRRSWRTRLAYALAALAVLVGGTLAASPAARSTVLEWLGIKSVEIKHEPPRATPGPKSTFGEALSLGDPLPISDARHVPAALGTPDAVWDTTFSDGTPAQSLVYKPRPGIPASTVTGIGLLVQTFQAKATPFIQKTAASAADVQRLTVDGDPAYFLTDPHGFAFTTDRGTAFEEQRLADRTLLVERRDGLLIRIEGKIDRAKAVAIARSIKAG
jgi:hypothetical protein